MSVDLLSQDLLCLKLQGMNLTESIPYTLAAPPKPVASNLTSSSNNPNHSLGSRVPAQNPTVKPTSQSCGKEILQWLTAYYLIKLKFSIYRVVIYPMAV